MSEPVVGVDEAGKGPVLGSMFAAAVRVPEPGVLPEGVADSKRLSPERRERLAGRLREDPAVAVGVAEIPVERIDDPATDMNALTAAAHVEALGAVARDGDRVLADAGDTSERRFARRLADGLAGEVGTDGLAESADGDGLAEGADADDATAVEVTAEHGADDAHAVVGAASVVAKVERDAHVERLAEAHPDAVATHGDLGSGYPSDPATRSFLESYVAAEGTVPPFARRSWSTCEDLLAEREQSGLGEY